MTKYKRGSAWKRTHWDKWSFGRKCLHVLAVIAALIVSAIMFIGTTWFVLFVFGVAGFLETVRDKILLQFVHWLIG